LNNLIPDGYFFDEHVVFGDLGKGSVLTRGSDILTYP